MKKNTLLIAGASAALGLALIALPGRSATDQDLADSAAGRRQKLENLQAKLEAQQGRVQLAQARAQEASQRALAQMQLALQKVQDLPGPEVEALTVLQDDEGPSWLGVETHEVTSDSAKELKLPAERGVVVGGITPDSPAAKAGLKKNDVITEVNGQRVEGSAQFRRMIHEIPAGRTAQLTVWRDARAQTLSATLGKAEEGHRAWTNAEPGAFSFPLPEVVEIPEIPSIEWDNGMMILPGAHPRLGIDAEDVSGQLGAFFGAPDGEGILVRSVASGSAAEKAGVKSGDVITTFNGDRIRSLGDLREKLAAKNDDKPAKLGVLRNKSEITVTVELPAPKTKTLHKRTHSTNI
jgi:C-terminal processing protease CtpA/Prc